MLTIPRSYVGVLVSASRMLLNRTFRSDLKNTEVPNILERISKGGNFQFFFLEIASVFLYIVDTSENTMVGRGRPKYS